MPVIKDYRQQTSVPGVVERSPYNPDMFGAAEGRAQEKLGAAVSGIGELMAKRIDQQNASDVTAKMAAAQAELSIDLQETLRKAPPGDPKPFEDYQKRVEEKIGKVGDEAESLSARNFYQEASARVKGQLGQTAAAGQAHLAGVKAVQDYQTTINGLTISALSDPTSLGLQRDFNKAAVQGLVDSGQMPAAQGAQLQQEGDLKIVQSAIKGWANLNPTYAKEKVNSGEFDSILGAEGKIKVLGEIDNYERGRELDRLKLKKLQEEQVQIDREKTQNRFLEAMTNNQLTSKDILNSNLEAFGSGSKQQFLGMLKASTTAPVKTDASVMISAFDRINLPDGDPNKITDENELNQYYINKQISFTDLNRLRTEMQGGKTEAGKIENQLKKQVYDIAKGMLTKSDPLTGFRDPVGDEQLQRFNIFFLEEYKQQRAKGVSATALLDPESPQYLGKFISNYKRTPQQIMRDLAPKKSQPAGGLATTAGVQAAEAATGRYIAPPSNVTPRVPGESAAAYLARTKGK